MDLQEIIKALTEHAGASPVVPGGSDIEERISKLAEAVQTAVDGNMQLAEIVKKLSADVEQFGAFTGAWDGMAKAKDREDGIAGMKDKYGAHAEYGPLASAIGEIEGTEIWPMLWQTLSQAKDEAEKAGGDPFDEDKFIGEKFSSMRDELGRASDAYGKIKPVAAEVTVATAEPEKPKEISATEPAKGDEYISDGELDEEKAASIGAKIGARARERMNANEKK